MNDFVQFPMKTRQTHELSEEEIEENRIWNLKEVVLSVLQRYAWPHPQDVNHLTPEARQDYAAALHKAAEEYWA